MSNQAIKRHGRTLNAWCLGQRGQSEKGIYSVGFHLCDILEKARLWRQISGCREWGAGDERVGEAGWIFMVVKLLYNPTIVDTYHHAFFKSMVLYNRVKPVWSMGFCNNALILAQQLLTSVPH